MIRNEDLATVVGEAPQQKSRDHMVPTCALPPIVRHIHNGSAVGLDEARSRLSSVHGFQELRSLTFLTSLENLAAPMISHAFVNSDDGNEVVPNSDR